MLQASQAQLRAGARTMETMARAKYRAMTIEMPIGARSELWLQLGLRLGLGYSTG